MTFTFGKSIASQRLELLVSRDPIARRRITSLLSNFSANMQKILTIKDPDVVLLCWKLFRDYTINRINAKTTLSDDMRTYTKNVVTSRYREYFHRYKSAQKKKLLTSSK